MANPEHVAIVKAGAEAIAAFRVNAPNERLQLNGEDLSGLKFERADFRNANLFRANLIGADLSFAELSEALLAEANLSDAKMFQCDLRGADLSGAILDRALMNRSYLFQTDFFEASLHNADLADSHLGGTRFGASDLTGVKGLDSVHYHSPSTIGIDTIERCGRNLPESFLQGCGVAESWIQQIPSLISNDVDFYSCFISYSHADKQFAKQLHDRLQGEGIRCWLDSHAMKPGDDMYAAVDKAIRHWDKVLLCCSDASLSSWWVEREIDTAIEKEQEFRKAKGEQILKIIPLNLDGSLFKWEGSHAAVLRKRLAADFTNWKRNADKFEREFENVVKALRTDDGPPPPEPKLGQ